MTDKQTMYCDDTQPPRQVQAAKTDPNPVRMLRLPRPLVIDSLTRLDKVMAKCFVQVIESMPSPKEAVAWPRSLEMVRIFQAPRPFSSRKLDAAVDKSFRNLRRIYRLS